MTIMTATLSVQSFAEYIFADKQLKIADFALFIIAIGIFANVYAGFICDLGLKSQKSRNNTSRNNTSRNNTSRNNTRKKSKKR